MDSMTALPILQEAATILYRQFDIEGDQGLVDEDKAAFEYLKQLLSERIRYLIDHDMEQFLFVLYRIDIEEQKVKEVLATYPLNEAIEAIAVLIIERQKQKVITRRQYATGSNTDDELSW